MKTIFKTLFLFSFFIFINCFLMQVNALENDELQIYPIKDKKSINDILSFYEQNNKTVIKIVDNKNRLSVKEDENENDIEDTVYEEEFVTSDNNIPENSYNYNQEVANFDSNYTDLANYALQFVGNPYVYGGTSLTEGTDCSGFVMLLYQKFGVALPRTSGGQATVGYGVSIENAQPGDIVSYGYNGIVSHSAIYIGNEMIVHASTPQGGIRTDSMYIMPIITIRRVG